MKNVNANVVVLSAVLFASGCAVPVGEEMADEPISSVASELTTTKTVNVGDGTASYNRYLAADPAVHDYRLYMNATDLAAGRLFSHYTYKRWVTYCSLVPYYSGCASIPNVLLTDDDYDGCGRKAAQNVLRYFGIEMSQATVDDDVPGINVPFNGDIATFPDQLRSGLQKILDRKAKGSFTVRRHSGVTKDAIRAELAKGMPVVALVDNGSHWIVISGRSSGGSWYVQDQWSSYWKSNTSLSLQFSGVPAWASIADFFTSYEEGTIITFARSTATGGGGGGTSPSYPIDQR